MKILIAEPVRTVSFSLQLLLSRRGMEADTVFDGVQALERLTNGDYDLLISETDLPRINGETLVRLASQRGVTVKTIGILPRSEVAERDLVSGYGMDALLPKPFSVIDLIALIEELEREEKEAYPKLLFHQRHLMNRLNREKTLSVGQVKDMLPETFGSVHAFVRSTNARLEKAGEKRRIVSDADGYKVVNV